MQLSKYIIYLTKELIVHISANLISFLIKRLPNKIRKEVIYPKPRKSLLNEEASEISEKGYLIINLRKNKDTFKTIQRIQFKAKEIISKLNLKEVKNPKDNKNFLKVLTKYFDPRDLYFIGHDKFILKIVENYFGFCPTVRTIDVWMTIPTSNNASETQLFHRDKDDHKLLKLFIPLKDVNFSNGPFQYIEGSHEKIAPQEFNSSNKKGRISLKMENEVINSFSKTFSFESSFGDACLADTRGLHRGLKIKQGYRLMIAISYTSPSPYFPYMGVSF